MNISISTKSPGHVPGFCFYAGVSGIARRVDCFSLMGVVRPNEGHLPLIIFQTSVGWLS